MDSNNFFTVKSNHPSLEGHFPGNPVVAGVIILDEISNIIIKHNHLYKICGFNQVKFLKPLLAEQKAEVSLDTGKVNSEKNLIIKFSAFHNGSLVTQGTAKLEKHE